MKKSALYVQNEASKKYNPYALMGYLIHTEDGIAIVDRNSIVKNEDDERLLYVIFNKDYGWNYSDIGNATIYYEVCNGKIYGGVYREGAGCITRKLVAVESKDAAKYAYLVYSYCIDTFKEIIRRVVCS